jgi:pyruvate-formate lyase-activating enzyme
MSKSLSWRIARKVRSIVSPRRTAQPRAPSARRWYEDQGLAHTAQPDPGGDGQAGVFFRYSLTHIPAGRHTVRCAVQFPQTPQGGTLTLACRLDGELIASVQAEADIAPADAIDFPIVLPRHGIVELTGHVTRALDRTHLRTIAVHEDDGARAPDYRFVSPFDVWPLQSLRDIVIGTTGVCNASCPHCPTNKAMLAGRVQAPMAWDLFQRIIDQLADGFIPLEGQLAFGLFGDSLMDPQVVERARYAKRRLPQLSLVLNTNAGPFNERRHAELAEIADCFSVHAEAVSPDIYGRLMAPLKAEGVLPKIERLAALAPGKVEIVSPMSQVNLKDYPVMRAYWAERGIGFTPLTISNRTTDQLDFYAYALAPRPGVCRQEVAHDLIVDWDGQVLSCCQDFTRGNAVGDLAAQSLKAVLADGCRRTLYDTLAEGRWSDFDSCRNCKFDHGEVLHRTLAEQIMA